VGDVVAVFRLALHESIDRAQEGLRAARREGLPDEGYAHAARLLDLEDRAHAAGVDTAGWVAPELLAVARALAGDDGPT
jgi:hypothetical protein